MFDADAVRAEFPVFEQTIRQRVGERGSTDARFRDVPVTFLDTAASAQKPRRVIEKEHSVQATHYANAYRGVYRFGAEIDEELEATREAIRSFINAKSARQIAFTAGTTMAINIIAAGWGRTHLQPGDEILLNLLEHHANFVPWQQVAAATGAVLKFIPLTDDCQLDMERLPDFLSERTRVLAVTGMSNVTGTLPSIGELAQAVHARGGIIAVDGAQSVPHGGVDVQRDDIDFLSFSGHKIYGPTGVGVLYGREELLQQTEPLLFGGHMIHTVDTETSTWADIPARFEAGTLPIVQAIALREAIQFVVETGIEHIQQHEHDLLQYAHKRLEAEVPGLRILGPSPQDKGAIVTFTIENVHPEDLAHLLDRCGVFVRHGHHCTMPLHTWLNIPASVRASFGMYNTRDDVDRLVEGIHFARKKLRL